MNIPNWHEHFVGDLAPEGAHECVIVRSKRRTTTIDHITPPHTEPSDDWRLLVGANIPGRNQLQLFGSTMALLATDTIEYIGEPLGLLVAPTQPEALTLASAVRVQYGSPPAEAAANEPTIDAPTIDAPAATNAFSTDKPSVGVAATGGPAATDGIVGHYSTAAQGCLRLAPQGAVAMREGKHCTVYCTTQWPFHVRSSVAAALGIPERNCRVRVCRIDLQMDDRLWFPSHIAALAAVAAWHCDHPVRLILAAREEFLYAPKRMPTAIDLRTTSTRRGNHIDAHIQITTSSMSPMVPEVTERLEQAIVGEYRWAKKNIAVVGMRANLPSLDVCGDMGDGAATFALECHINHCAEVQQESPVAWRVARLPADGAARMVLHKVAEVADFERKYASYHIQRMRRDYSSDRELRRGIGIALSGQHSDLGTLANGIEARVGLKRAAAGAMHFECGGVSWDWRARRVWRAAIGELLDIEPKMVQIDPVDTDTTPDPGPSIAGRNITTILRLARVSGYAARRRQRHKWPPRKENVLLKHSGTRSRHRYSRAAAAIEVAVDPCLLTIDIRGIWLIIHAGAILERETARATVQRDVIAALHWALGPQLDYSRGQLASEIYDRLLGLEHAQQKQIWVDFIESTHQPCGIGGLAYGCVTAALAAALSQALDCTIDRLPVSEEYIGSHIEERAARGATKEG